MLRVVADVPFTFAHPAAVVPLRRLFGRHSDPAALVIGSMLPDGGYFLALNLPRDSTHSIAALFLFCLPVGIVSYFFYRLVLREALLAAAPAMIGRRMARAADRRLPRSAATWLVVVLSLLLGAATHLLWDGFTHRDHLPLLGSSIPNASLFTLGGRTIGVFELLQHGTALLGLLLMAWWTQRWMRNTRPRPHGEGLRLGRIVRRIVQLLAALSVIGYAMIAATSEDGIYAGGTFVGRAARAVMPAMTLVIILYGVGWQIWRRVREARPSSSTDR